MSAVCKEGHLSDEPDYCSVCGGVVLSGSAGLSPMASPVSAPSSGASSPAASGGCPSCGEPREDLAARFCEVCRYDFQERRAGPPPVAKASTPSVTRAAEAPPPPPTAARAPATAPAASAAAAAWELVITVDPKLDTEPDPASPCPRDQPPVVLAVDKDDLLVGRHDDTRAIHPEVSLHDPGASRRHARFVREPDGSVALQDLASTNGTQVNGVEVPPGTRRRLVEGDSVTLGRWTRITLRARP